jgi:hypothetical protein
VVRAERVEGEEHGVVNGVAVGGGIADIVECKWHVRRQKQVVVREAGAEERLDPRRGSPVVVAGVDVGGDKVGVEDQEAGTRARGLGDGVVFGGELAASDRVGVIRGEGAGDALGVFAGVLGDPDGLVALGEARGNRRLAGALGADQADAVERSERFQSTIPLMQRMQKRA